MIQDLWKTWVAERAVRRHIGDNRDVLLFRTATPDLYPVGYLWEDHYGRWWRVTSHVTPERTWHPTDPGPLPSVVTEIRGDRAGPLREVT
jgi:hypothetical protein